MTEALKQAIEAAEKLADVEELYLPYKEQRTKTTVLGLGLLWHSHFAK